MNHHLKSRNNKHGKALFVRRAGAAAFTLSITTASALLPPAMAVTPFQVNEPAFGTPDGSFPVVTTNASVSDDTVEPGQNIEYTFRATMKAPVPVTTGKPGESDLVSYTFFVAAHPDAPFDRPLQERDIKWTGGTPTDVQIQDFGGRFRVVVTAPAGVSETSATITLPATVSSSVTPGKVLDNWGSAASASILPKHEWSSTPTQISDTNDVCVKRADTSLTFNGGQYGSWLGEMFFGTTDKNVVLEGQPQLSFTNPDGADITGAMTAHRTFTDSPSAPVEKNLINTVEPGTTFTQQYNWPLDVNNATGNTWVPSGTTVHVTQNVRDTTCDPSTADPNWSVQYSAAASSFVYSRESDAQDLSSFRVVDAQPQPASLGDYAWVDANRDGVQDPDEKPAPGVTVILRDDNGTEIKRSTTDNNGAYSFTDLTPGTYTVEFETPNGFEPSPAGRGDNPAADSNGSTSKVTLAPGENNTTIDFGINKPEPKLASLGDYAWVDANRDGVQDPDEKPAPGVTVILRDDNGTEIKRSTTDNNGAYSFTDLTPGTYTVEFETPNGFEPSPAGRGDNPAADSNGSTSKVTLAPGENNTTIDFGINKPEPNTPATPGNPTDSTPATPGNPTDSTPATPGNPTDSTPATPGNPTDSTPATPGNPTDSTPATPGNPTDSTPATPGNPTDSTPATPGNPADGRENQRDATPEQPESSEAEVDEASRDDRSKLADTGVHYALAAVIVGLMAVILGALVTLASRRRNQ